MAGTHGDLFSEIGKLVVAAHDGESIDLEATSVEMADRYVNLGLPADAIARAIARSLGAISISMQVLHHTGRRPAAAMDESADRGAAELLPSGPEIHKDRGDQAPTLFPSGVRLAMLS